MLNLFGLQIDVGFVYFGSYVLSGDFCILVGCVKGLDVCVSWEIGDWFGVGLVVLVLGGEFCKEVFYQDIQDFVGNVQSFGVDFVVMVSGECNLKVQYVEFNVLVLDSLEFSVVICYDKYSDFGSISNLKYLFCFQLFCQLVLCGVYSEGFCVLLLYELYNLIFIIYISVNYDDLCLCVGGQLSQGGIVNCDCVQQFYNVIGGNIDL